LAHVQQRLHARGILRGVTRVAPEQRLHAVMDSDHFP
jgi:hypothetical protein